MDLVVFDTSVWVEELRRGVLEELWPALRMACRLRMDAVTAAELRAGCRSKAERRDVERCIAPFERTGRLLQPEPRDFLRAARALSRLREAGWTMRRPGGALLDGLIAATATRIGASLITLNVADFSLLARRMPLRCEAFERFRARLPRQGV